VAGELGIAPSFLASRATLAALARNNARTIAEMMACSPILRWQAELLKPGVVRVLRGQPLSGSSRRAKGGGDGRTTSG